ncbi:MAG: carboxypeptidase regulatory-like domain-containing protein [Calditrichaeota bacterium]|nr:carboxypeptidase regulatory-like domain-containing protein [Calditrichota bacterium]
MALTKPYATRKFILYEGDKLQTKVSFVVELCDKYTGKFPDSRLYVRLKNNRTIKPIINPSGYYCFVNLPPADYQVVVEPDIAKQNWYLKEEASIDIRANDFNPAQDILKFILSPRTAYPFPGNATLIMGVVQSPAVNNQNPIPIEEAQIVASGKNKELFNTRTDENGGYAIFFNNVPNYKIKITARKRINGNEIVRTRSGIKVIEGEIASVNILNFVIP